MTGYKQPPRSTQFRKGHSGNPTGRPRGRGSFKADLLQVMGQNVFITENGQRRAVSGRKAVAIKLFHDALRDAKTLANLTAHLLKHDFDADTRPEAEPVTENDRIIIEDFLRRNSIPPAKEEKP
jgi:uncharacterized protein DUF5681